MEIIEVIANDENKNKNVVSQEEIPYLSEEVIQNILTQLPFDSLINSRLVCKMWSNIIRDPFVTYSSLFQSEPGLIIQQRCMYRGHYNTYFMAMKDEQITVREFSLPYIGNIYCSCNGLVLLLGKEVDLCIANFVTKQQVSLPCTSSNTISVSFGFAFVPCNGEYKVVHLYLIINSVPYLRCEILTLGFDKWRHVDLPLLIIRDPSDTPISAKGFLHWHFSSMDLRGSILSMDMCDEKIYSTALPSCSRPFKLLDIGGFLSLLSKDFLIATVWILKDSYRGIWVKQLQINLGVMPGLRSLRTIDFLGSLKNGKVIIFRRHCNLVPCYYHYAYDIKHHQLRRVAVNIKNGRQYAISHVNSLISWGQFSER